jgi:amidohydrolase
MALRVAPVALRSAFAAVLLLPMAMRAAEAPLPQQGLRIAQAAEALRPKLVELRRDFHRHPELAYHEERTARIVAERLRAVGFDEVRTNVARHGVAALLHGALPGAVVGVRADMDALPIAETNHQPYCSTVPGVMHACGHDAHTTIVLGVAEVLSRMRGQLPGSVKFLFQPAEENAGEGELSGAPLMIREGALEHPRPLALFGLHTSPELEVGTIGYHSGPAQAAIDVFTITIRGKVPYGATPQLGVDTIVVAAQCISALQTIKSRRLDPLEPVVLTVGAVHGGNGPFNTPSEVKLQGSVRAFSNDARTRIAQLMRETLAGVTAAYGATFDLQSRPVTAVLVNDPKLVEASLPSLRRALGAANVIEVPQRMGGEDFSYYSQVVPGFFFRLGSGNKAKGITAAAHTPAFDIDEDCLVVGVKALATVVVEFLDRQAGRQ